MNIRTGHLLVAALAAAVPNAGVAQNLLANPDFDTDLSGWTIPGVAWLASSFDAEDWAGDPASGSLRAVNTAVGSESAGPYQCIAIPESDGQTAIYDMRAQARVADGDFLAGVAELGLWYYETSECGGVNWGNHILYWGLEQWPSVGEFGLDHFLVPAGTRSILFELRANKYQASESFEARFDHAYLPEPAAAGAAWAALVSLAALRAPRSRAGRARQRQDARSVPTRS